MSGQLRAPAWPAFLAVGAWVLMGLWFWFVVGVLA